MSDENNKPKKLSLSGSGKLSLGGTLDSSSLRSGDVGDGDIVADAFVEDVHGIRTKAHRGDHRADMRLEEGARGKGPGAARRDIQHLDDGRDMLRDGKCGGDRLCRVADQRIGCVDVEIEHLGHVGRDTAAREPRDVGEPVLQPGEIMEIGQG